VTKHEEGSGGTHVTGVDQTKRTAVGGARAGGVDQSEVGGVQRTTTCGKFWQSDGILCARHLKMV
jgi:hypothetical protein